MKQAIRIMDTVHEASKAESEAHPAVPGPAVESRHTHTGVNTHAPPHHSSWPFHERTVFNTGQGCPQG